MANYFSSHFPNNTKILPFVDRNPKKKTFYELPVKYLLAVLHAPNHTSHQDESAVSRSRDMDEPCSSYPAGFQCVSKITNATKGFPTL